MKVLHLNTWDQKGGASRGAYWTHRALLGIGVDSRMLVAYKDSYDPTVLGPNNHKIFEKLISEIRPNLDSLPLKLYRQKQPDLFSPAVVGSNVVSPIRQFNPDIINLHWIGQGFIRPESLKQFHCPLVWTMRDMWPFTGGCHYADDCQGYTSGCGHCPKLGSKRSRDLSSDLLKRKQKSWGSLNLTLIAPSRWMADCAKQSVLFRDRPIQVIPSAVNITTFQPRSRSLIRQIFNFSPQQKIVLFIALRALKDKRKGWQYLVNALPYLAESSLGNSLHLIVVGNTEPLPGLNEGDLNSCESQGSTNRQFAIPVTGLGTLQDDLLLSLVYAMADVTVVPSLQDNFPKVPVESLACGTPVVAFDNTGCKDIVDHQSNGYLAQCFSAEDLAKGMIWVLEDQQRWQKLCERSRQKVEAEFSPDRQAKAYKNLYQDILAKVSKKYR